MPSKSEKESLTELMLMMWTDDMLNGENKWTFFKDDNEAMEMCTILNQIRYVNDRIPVPRSRHWLETILSNSDFDEKRFRQHLRCDRERFVTILGLIKDNPVFTDSQEPIAIQLAIALNKFGTFGNASSIGTIADKFGVSEGGVSIFIRRVIQSLVDINQEWIKWPDSEERKNLGSSMVTNLLPKCIGYVDGSEAVLFQAPLQDKETYWSRKKNYSIQFQIICDTSRYIRNFFTGYPGSVHDAKVFQSSPFGLNMEGYLSPGEFIIGDSAYTLSKNVIVPYRRRLGNLDEKQRNFNHHISSHRVAVEHTIGILKGRFQSLLGLRIRVDKMSGHEFACKWIMSCAILHNILLKTDPWNQENDFIYTEIDVNNPNVNNVYLNLNEGELKRNALCEIINAMQ